MQIHRFVDPNVFLGRAEPFLVRAEVENNLLLGICGPPGSPPRLFGEDRYLATVEDAGKVVACAIRTPPYRAIITRASQRACECLVDDLAAKYERLPAVLGPEPDVSLFAQLWSDRTGTPARAGMRQRLFEARQVQPLRFRPAGALRRAQEADLPTIAPWVAAFSHEAHLTDPSDPQQWRGIVSARAACSFGMTDVRSLWLRGPVGRSAASESTSFTRRPSIADVDTHRHVLPI